MPPRGPLLKQSVDLRKQNFRETENLQLFRQLFYCQIAGLSDKKDSLIRLTGNACVQDFKRLDNILFPYSLHT